MNILQNHKFKLLTNLLLGITFSLLTIYLVITLIGKDYFNSTQPPGGDYYNFLTYAHYFKNNLLFPPSGWLPFFNEGQPVIGGYPWFGYYLMLPFLHALGTSTGMNIFAIVSHIAFFIACLMLYFTASRSWVISFLLTFTTFITPASHMQLTTGGFIVASSSQFYLPLSLAFLIKFLEKKKSFWLVLVGITTGLSLLHHAPTNLIILFIPVLATLSLSGPNRLTSLTIYLLLSFSIGISGIYSTLLQSLYGSGKSVCINPECWGNYPRHLISWFDSTPIIVIVGTTLLSLIISVRKKSILKRLFIPSVAGFAVIVSYCLLAYLKLINGTANVIWPTRTFWAFTVYLALFCATSYRSFHSLYPKLSAFFSPILSLSILIIIFTQPISFHKETPNTYPKDLNLNKTHLLIPSWIKSGDQNRRLDSVNSGIVQWFNFVSSVPSVRGYSNHPLGNHADWQFFLGSLTRNPPSTNTNQAIFALDHFGVGYIDNTTSTYPPELINNKQLISRSEVTADFSWHETNSQIFSPILSGTNGVPLLFVGSNEEYSTFVRALSFTGLTSQKLIPIHGPSNPDKLTPDDLKYFKHLFISSHIPNNIKNIDKYLVNGGNIFWDISVNTVPNQLPDFFPVSSLSLYEANGDWPVDKSTAGIPISEFSPLKFGNQPWKLYLGSGLKPESSYWLSNSDNSQIILSQRNYGQGTIILSSFNFLYHIVQTSNDSEVKLFKKVLTSLIPDINTKPTYASTNISPTLNSLTGNFGGVYFKQNYDTGWKFTRDKKSLPIYKAGFDYMYSPTTNTSIQTIEVKYTGNFSTWGIFIANLLGICTGGYLLVNHSQITKKLNRYFHSLTKHEE